jgi:protein ImuB
MFACLSSLSAPHSTLIRVAQEFTPRYEVIGSGPGSLVMLDLSGLSRLFGSAQEIGDQLRRSMAGAPVRIAIAPSQTAAALLALGRPGLTVVAVEEQPAALAPLQVGLLGDLERLHVEIWRSKDLEILKSPNLQINKSPNLQINQSPNLQINKSPNQPISKSPNSHFAPHVGEMEDVLPYFQSCLDRTSEAARAPHANCALGEPQGALSLSKGGGGWTHPRDAHAAKLTKRTRRSVPITKDTEHPHTATGAQKAAMTPPKTRAAMKEVERLLDVLRRWGVKTLGALAALAAGDVYERLGARGVLWQRLARGEDQGPLVPCVPEEPFEGTLDLEWPIEGLEPLSFVLARVFEPLAERLERADRGAAILHTHLRLTTREVHARTVQLPAPMRDPKTLRTLVLLDLESNPPSAALDRVRVLIEPTPARVLQWTLYERAQPTPEQVSTLLARLTALMGEGHVGSPAVMNSWKPGAFEMRDFTVAEGVRGQVPGVSQGSECATALRRYRLPIPARVQMQDGRPVRVMVDRRGVTGGAVEQSAGPWRTSGEWWNDGPARNWDRDEWDVLLGGGETYRIYVERDVGQWFVEGVVD